MSFGFRLFVLVCMEFRMSCLCILRWRLWCCYKFDLWFSGCISSLSLVPTGSLQKWWIQGWVLILTLVVVSSLCSLLASEKKNICYCVLSGRRRLERCMYEAEPAEQVNCQIFVNNTEMGIFFGLLISSPGSPPAMSGVQWFTCGP